MSMDSLAMNKGHKLPLTASLVGGRSVRAAWRLYMLERSRVLVLVESCSLRTQ
jgi:hypothetical protein